MQLDAHLHNFRGLQKIHPSICIFFNFINFFLILFWERRSFPWPLVTYIALLPLNAQNARFGGLLGKSGRRTVVNVPNTCNFFRSFQFLGKYSISPPGLKVYVHPQLAFLSNQVEQNLSISRQGLKVYDCPGLVFFFDQPEQNLSISPPRLKVYDCPGQSVRQG